MDAQQSGHTGTSKTVFEIEQVVRRFDAHEDAVVVGVREIAGRGAWKRVGFGTALPLVSAREK